MPGELREPAVGSRWIDGEITLAPGSKFARLRVMAVVEGYVVARRTGCAPFVESVRRWHERFRPAGRALLGGSEHG